CAGVAGALVLGAGARVVAGYPFVRRDAVAGARGGIADLGGAEVRVLPAGHRLRATGAAALRPHAVVHGTRIVVVADRAADGGIGAASDDVAVCEVQLNIGRLRHLDRLRLRTRRHVAELRPAGVRDATSETNRNRTPQTRDRRIMVPPPSRPVGPALSCVSEGPYKRRAGSEVRRTLTCSTMCSGGFTQRGCCAPPARTLDASTHGVHVPGMPDGACAAGECLPLQATQSVVPDADS